LRDPSARVMPVDTAPPPITMVTWNLQGSNGVDIAGVGEVIAAAHPDVVAIQEIQRGQARRLAAALGMAHLRWAFKNLSFLRRPEGLAVISRHRLLSADAFLLRRAWLWNWRRRIGLAVEIDRNEGRFGVINVHLSPHDDGDRRRREAHLAVERARVSERLPIIVGDFNDLPGGPGYDVVTGSGWSDSWLIDKLQDIEGPTNWTPGERRGRPPSQRLDFVFVPPGWSVVDAKVLAESDRFDWFADRSDHLPLLAAARPPDDPGLP